MSLRPLGASTDPLGDTLAFTVPTDHNTVIVITLFLWQKQILNFHLNQAHVVGAVSIYLFKTLITNTCARDCAPHTRAPFSHAISGTHGITSNGDTWLQKGHEPLLSTVLNIFLNFD